MVRGVQVFRPAPRFAEQPCYRRVIRHHNGFLRRSDWVALSIGGEHAQHAEVELDRVHPFQFVHLLDRLHATRCGSGWVLENDYSSIRMLLMAQLDAELDVKHRFTQLPLDLCVGHLRIFEEVLQGSERPAHGTCNQYETLVRANLLQRLVALRLVGEIPWQPG